MPGTLRSSWAMPSSSQNGVTTKSGEDRKDGDNHENLERHDETERIGAVQFELVGGPEVASTVLLRPGFRVLN